MHRRLKKNLLAIWGAMALVGAATLAIALMLQAERARLLAAESRLAGALIAFERSIGYGGFIHGFKNMILRPGEPAFRRRAVECHARALGALVTVEEIAAELGHGVDLGEVRAVLLAYHGMLDVAQDMLDEGHTSREVDAVVRVDDSLALGALDGIEERIQRSIDGDLDALAFHQFLAILGAVAALAAAGGASFLVYRRSLRADLRVAVERLKTRNTDMERLTQIVAHDLRSPLRQISGLANMAHEDLRDHGGPPPGDLATLLPEIEGRARKLDAMVEEILALMRIGTGRAEAAPIDLAAMIRETVALSVPPGATCRVEGEMPTVRAVPAELRTVIRNLLDNAVKHGPTEGLEIRLEARRKGARTLLEVTDNGPGIAPEHRERVFEMFSTLDRPDDDDDDDEASGVGLAVVRRIVRGWGGEVTVREAEGGGAVFAVVLP